MNEENLKVWDGMEQIDKELSKTDKLWKYNHKYDARELIKALVENAEIQNEMRERYAGF